MRTLAKRVLGVVCCIGLVICMSACTNPQSEGNISSSSSSSSSSASSSSSSSASSSSLEPKASVDAYTWDELSKISIEISKSSTEKAALDVARKYNLTSAAGTLDGTQAKSVTLKNGIATQAQIAGFYHDEKDGTGKAGITFIFKDAIADHAMNNKSSSAGGWKSSDMRTWLNETMISQFPDDLKNQIVSVSKQTNNTGKVETLAEANSAVTATTDKLWLFSPIEILGKYPESTTSGGQIEQAIWDKEGKQYKLFADCGISFATRGTSFDILSKSFNGKAYEWWLRPPDYSANGYFETMSAIGEGDCTTQVERYVVPGFCI